MAEYVGASGFVQFDPNTRDANGQSVTDVTIKTPGSDGVLVRISLWPEFAEAAAQIEKGDFVAVDGKLNIGEYTKDGEKRTSVQINASQLAFVKGVQRAEREVVNEGAAQKDPF